MAHRIEVATTIEDARARVRKEELNSQGISVNDVILADAYTIDAELHPKALSHVATQLTNPVFQQPHIDTPFTPAQFDHAVEVGYLPGVTDNIGSTVTELMRGALQTPLESQAAYSSQVMFLSGTTAEDAHRAGLAVANPLIQRVRVKTHEEFMRDNGMGIYVPRVHLTENPHVTLVDILNADDATLSLIGKQGIANADGSRRGPLALDLTYMHAIRAYFRKEGRNPTDVEIEDIAQTWSEHCHHTILADPIDDITDGLYKHYIKRATEDIRRAKGDKDFCVSVFRDNSGGIWFDENHLITHKVETHNSPSALDPFGGSITGIVGVDRDAMGFGLGAKPVGHLYGFCLASPDDTSVLYRDAARTQELLSARRIMDGVIAGVNAGGNQSGIPTPQGFMYFDERFRGKPLVFVGVLGVMPAEIGGRKLYEKQAQAGDHIVMIGGRVGKDGIHGATFSSEALDSGSPATAVQIGDPITQKKASDALIKEARDKKLYRSLTDNGAGGLSCSVAEMAKESGGFVLELDRVPLKYPGLAPWEISISESQERMTAAVPSETLQEFMRLMQRRGVEATVIGTFTNSGRAIANYGNEKVMDLDMHFLHDGLPQRPMQTTFTRQRHEEPEFTPPQNLTESLHGMLRRRNLASISFVSEQFDHEVQGGSVLKPLQGRGRVNADATVFRPLLRSRKAAAISHGINPSYSDIDTYDMAASAIDTAVRNTIAVGGNLDAIALLDNFCWCSSNEPERLGQLKRAAKACYDTAVAYGTPFISGKDSMFNDSKGYDADGKPIKISIPPTLLASSLAVLPDAQRAMSLDFKVPGDLIYVVGETADELGGSEYYAMIGEQARGKRFIGNNVPVVNTTRNKQTYTALSNAIREGLVASAQSIHRGGLAIALAKSSMGGMLGVDTTIHELGALRDDTTLYSESQGRVLVSVAPLLAKAFEDTMSGVSLAHIGRVIDNGTFAVHGKDTTIHTDVRSLLDSYRSTFKGY